MRARVMIRSTTAAGPPGYSRQGRLDAEIVEGAHRPAAATVARRRGRPVVPKLFELVSSRARDGRVGLSQRVLDLPRQPAVPEALRAIAVNFGGALVDDMPLGVEADLALDPVVLVDLDDELRAAPQRVMGEVVSEVAQTGTAVLWFQRMGRER